MSENIVLFVFANGIALVGAVITYLIKVNSIEKKIEYLESNVEKVNQTHSEKHLQSENKFDKMENKLDNLSEKLNENTMALVELKTTIANLLNLNKSRHEKDI